MAAGPGLNAVVESTLHPAHAVLEPLAGIDIDTVSVEFLNASACASVPPPVTAAGATITFARSSVPLRALDYERGILQSGVVPTRPGNRHDVFNALCWIMFPQFKRACNVLHTQSSAGARSGRGPVRDALTLLDESGVLVICADADLAALLRARQWKRLFHERRADVLRSMHFFVCGHALHEKLLEPYVGLTAKALILDAPPGLFDRSSGEQRRHADEQAARAIGAGITPADLSPLPLMGIPGWDPGNAEPGYYDDAAVFRPARSSTTAGNASTDSHSALAPASVNSAAEP